MPDATQMSNKKEGGRGERKGEEREKQSTVVPPWSRGPCDDGGGKPCTRDKKNKKAFASWGEKRE